LFTGGYEIDQDGTSPIVIGNGIPGADLTVTSPGVLTIDLSNAARDFMVPDGNDFFDLTLNTSFIQSASVVPEASPFALFLGALVTFFFFRHRMSFCQARL
jgi:hypothetical protein